MFSTTACGESNESDLRVLILVVQKKDAGLLCPASSFPKRYWMRRSEDVLFDDIGESALVSIRIVCGYSEEVRTDK
jgi:hypothetical protein